MEMLLSLEPLAMKSASGSKCLPTLRENDIIYRKMEK
jgi:hypothetical protein